MRKIKSIIINFCALGSCVAYCKEVYIPGGENAYEISKKYIEDYISPYEKFKDKGFLVEDRELKYSIDTNSLADYLKSDSDKLNENKSWLEKLIDLSGNHWIAINKRDFKIAEDISKNMLSILGGDFGVIRQNVSQTEYEKLMELKFRCIEQIEMSLRQKIDEPSLFNRYSKSENQNNDNLEELKCMYKVAKNITNTPLFFQLVSSNMVTSKGIRPRSLNHNYLETLEIRNNFINSVKDSIEKEFTKQKETIDDLLYIKENSYLKYLAHTCKIMKTKSLSAFQIIDQGQTSGPHRNTCMFNSVFNTDVRTKNLGSSKIDSLIKAENYLKYMDSLLNIYCNNSKLEDYTYKDTLLRNINKIKEDRNAPAEYSFTAELEKDCIFPGIIGQTSVLEMQCHPLMLNLIVFTNCFANSPLINSFGTGYFASENFAITAISGSYGHARALKAK